jgi:hypothetical protein
MAAPPPNYRVLAQQDAARYGLGPWFVNQIQQESGFNPNARSGAGAEGIAQFMPATARGVGLANPYDPVASLAAAAQFDAKLIKQYGSVPRALSAYNSGRPDAYQDPGFAGGQTYRYVKDILGGTTPDVSSVADTTAPQGHLAVAATHTAAASMAPPPDYRPRLAQELAAAASSQGNNLQAFYGTLAAALRARQAAAQPQPTDRAGAPVLPNHPEAPGPSRPVASFSGLIRGNTQGEQAAFLNDLARLAQYEHAPVDINSGYRSYAKQAQLYASRASNPNPVAPPGHSLHEQGLAADGTINGTPLGTLPAAVLARFGLATVPGDPVHIQLAR